MTKLGVTPGVHGEEVEKQEEELATVKVDPKVFTILQPIGTAPPTIVTTPPPRERSSSACRWLMFITLLTSATILTFFLCNLYLADQPLSKIFVITTPEVEPTATVAPKSEAQKSEPIVVLPVKQVDGGSENTSDRTVDNSVQQPRQYFNFANDPWMMAAQARWAQEAEDADFWKAGRIQQEAFRQILARILWERQQMVAEQQKAQWFARAQWEQAREQAVQAEQWRAEQMRQQQAAQAQEQWNQQWQQYYQAQAQQAQAQQAAQMQQQQQQQQQQQPQQNWQQLYWQNQQQQQPMPLTPHPRLILLRHLTRVLPIHMSFRLPEQPEQSQELPQPAIHDRIYQQLQRKSQGMEFNAPSRPIWTAITPTPETPTTKFDEEAAFQENLKKSLEHEAQPSTTAAPVAPEEDDEKHSESEDGVLKDIFSALASAASETSSTPAPETSSAENIFKPFSTDQDKKIDADVKEMANPNVFKPFETPEDKQQDSEKTAEKSGFSAFNAEGAPKEEVKIDEPQPQEGPIQESQESTEIKPDEPSLPVVVFEDRFPKLEERTTTSETPIASTESSKEEEGSEEQHDPLAAFLKYFEQEARRMAEIRAATSSEEPQPTEMAPEGEAAQSQPAAAVDVPEANFKPTVPITV